MLQSQRCHRVRHALRLAMIDWLRPALRHRAETATPRAQVPEHHERRGLVVPALSDVRAVRTLAHRVQIQITRQLLQRVKGLAHRRPRLQPLRLRRRLARRKINLHQLIGLNQWSHRTALIVPSGATQPLLAGLQTALAAAEPSARPRTPTPPPSPPTPHPTTAPPTTVPCPHAASETA